MTQVERLAQELAEIHYGSDDWSEFTAVARETWLALARHVLRRERAAVRRARGNVIGWTCLSEPDRGGDRHFVLRWAVTRKDAVGMSREEKKFPLLARVVAVPRKGGRK